jgi:ABC-2 type transport system permease protein
MSWSRIKGIITQDTYITRHELTLWYDLLIFSAMSALVFGFLSRYLSQSSNSAAGTYVLLGMVLWELVRVTQYCVSVNPMFNVWSDNLTNIFVAPVSIAEFVIGNCILSFVKGMLVFTVVACVAGAAFGFNVLSIGTTTLLLTIVVLTLFGWGLGWLLLGFIFRYGTGVQALAWGAIFVVQPFTAVYFPLTVLPSALRWFSWTLPPTYAFEAARRGLNGNGVAWSLLLGGLALDVIWMVGGIKAFSWLTHRSRVTGRFAHVNS